MIVEVRTVPPPDPGTWNATASEIVDGLVPPALDSQTSTQTPVRVVDERGTENVGVATLPASWPSA